MSFWGSKYKEGHCRGRVTSVALEDPNPENHASGEGVLAREVCARASRLCLGMVPSWPPPILEMILLKIVFALLSQRFGAVTQRLVVKHRSGNWGPEEPC